MQVEQVCGVGGRVLALLGAEGASGPIGEAVAFGQALAEQVLDQGRQRRGREAEKAGGQLCVEEPPGLGPARQLEYLEILLGRMGHTEAGSLEHPSQPGEVDAVRIDEGHSSWPHQLDEGQMRKVRPLAMELGVEAVHRRGLDLREQLVHGGLGVDPARAGQTAQPFTSPASPPVSSVNQLDSKPRASSSRCGVIGLDATVRRARARRPSPARASQPP